jgi:hypothetical protein
MPAVHRQIKQKALTLEEREAFIVEAKMTGENTNDITKQECSWMYFLSNSISSYFHYFLL